MKEEIRTSFPHQGKSIRFIKIEDTFRREIVEKMNKAKIERDILIMKQMIIQLQSQVIELKEHNCLD